MIKWKLCSKQPEALNTARLPKRLADSLRFLCRKGRWKIAAVHKAKSILPGLSDALPKLSLLIFLVPLVARRRMGSFQELKRVCMTRDRASKPAKRRQVVARIYRAKPGLPAREFT